MNPKTLIQILLGLLSFIVLAFLFSSFFLISTASKGALKPNDTEAIKENFRKQEVCWTAADIDCYCQAYAALDSVKMIYQGGVIYGKENINAFYKRNWNASNMGKLRFDNVDISPLGKKHYFVTGRYNLERGGQTSSGHFSVVMVKYKGEWKILSDHSS